jgi:hypothetical protein
VNNLYGYAMTQKLANKFICEVPLNEFEQETESFDKNGDYCYFLLIDYKVPESIHDKLEILPPLIGKKKVCYKDLSTEQKEIQLIKENYRSEKLCSTLEDGEDYLTSFDNYLFYKRMGYDITVKKVYKFEQEYLFNQYIDMNTGFRQQTKNELEKAFYKLLNNIIYGKCLENPEKYSNIELLTNEKIILKRLHNPLLKRCDIIVDDKLVLIDLNKDTLQYNTAVQIGFHILERSKLLMYESLYEKFIPFCNTNNVGIRLMMHDTDSFLFEFDLTKSALKDEKEVMLGLKSIEKGGGVEKSSGNGLVFDWHVYVDKDIRDTSQKKTVGLFLDEYSDTFEIVGFIGLCSKSYCYVLEKKLNNNLGMLR